MAYRVEVAKSSELGELKIELGLPHRGWWMLRGFQEGRLDRRRDLDRDKAFRREQVVLTAFVHDAKVSIALGVLVWKDNVNLVALERGLVSVVVDADRKPAARCGRVARSSRGTSCA